MKTFATANSEYAGIVERPEQLADFTKQSGVADKITAIVLDVHGAATDTIHCAAGIEPSRVVLLGRKEFGQLFRSLPRVGNIMLRNLGTFLAEQVITQERSRSTSLDDTNPLK